MVLNHRHGHLVYESPQVRAGIQTPTVDKVDDVHFLDRKRRDDRAVANHFKSLASTFSVTFLHVGVGLEARGLLDEGLSDNEDLAQNGRRMTALTVDTFDVDSEPGHRIWRDLLLAVEQCVVLADAFQGMIADELSDYLFARSTGHFASLMALVARGCDRAIQDGEESLPATPRSLELASQTVRTSRTTWRAVPASATSPRPPDAAAQQSEGCSHEREFPPSHPGGNSPTRSILLG